MTAWIVTYTAPSQHMTDTFVGVYRSAMRARRDTHRRARSNHEAVADQWIWDHDDETWTLTVTDGEFTITEVEIHA